MSSNGFDDVAQHANAELRKKEIVEFFLQWLNKNDELKDSMGKYLKEFLKALAHRSFKIGKVEVEYVEEDNKLAYRYFPSISNESEEYCLKKELIDWHKKNRK